LKRLLSIIGALVGVTVFVFAMGVLLFGILRNVSDLQEMTQGNGPVEPSERPSFEECQHALYIYCSSCGNIFQLYLKSKQEIGAENESKEENDEGDMATRPPQLPLIHDVLHGETLSSISLLYGVSVDAIVAYNEIRDVNRIYAGSALQIPGVFGGSTSQAGAGDTSNNMSDVE